MPFSVKLNLGSEHPVIFNSWIERAFGRYVLKGTAFAKATGPDGPGRIVTNGAVFLSSKGPFEPGAIIMPGSYVAYGSADGDEIPYGEPYCSFVRGS